MKSFNNIQELLDYCEFCPFCKEICRNIYFTAGPDYSWNILKSHIENNKIKFSSSFRSKFKNYILNIEIDCVSNKYNLQWSECNSIKFDQEAFNKANESYFYFYIQSDCKKCGNAASASCDLESDYLEKEFSNIKLDREHFFISDNKNIFNITLIHSSNAMMVSILDHGFYSASKEVELPMVSLDFSDQNKIISKLKTLILFS